MISVIIPTLNEQESIASLISFLKLSERVETIVVDGGSRDYTCDLAVALADKVLAAGEGRGVQMNAGAHVANGDILLFLHADSTLPQEWRRLIRAAMADRRVAGGAFDLRLNGAGPICAAIGRIASIRSRLLRTPYGDQGIFVRKGIFDDMGGFRPIPIMEDLDFSRRLKKRGELAFIPEPIVTSARKWEECGFMRTTAAHWAVTAGFYLGVPPVRLKPLYKFIISKPMV